MARSWRLLFYCGAAALSGFLSILSTYDKVDHDATIKNESEQPPFVNENAEESNINFEESGDDMVEEFSNNKVEESELSPLPLNPNPIQHLSRRAKIQPIVIAPWTKLVKKDGKAETRSFVFSEINRLDEYGLPVQNFDADQRDYIQKKMLTRLCGRSKKFASSNYAAQKCKDRMEMLKCISCSEVDGTWYAASSVTGAVFGKVDSESNVLYPYYNDGPFAYQQLDIAVPIAGQDDKLRIFADHLGSSVKKFREGFMGSRISIRLMVTRFPFDDYSDPAELEAFKSELIKSTALDRPGDSVVFIPVEFDSFSRAKAINALHRSTCHSDDCAIAVMDVDMNISSQFLRNALIFAFPGASAYFPIFWSEYAPDTIELVDKLLPHAAQWKYTDHHGYWRKSSYGMYVLAGPDANRIWMDEKFIGWGGEDNDFFHRVDKKLNIVRHRERGLTHVWHSKNCKLGSFVENDFFSSCVGALAHTEGSQLGMYLRAMKNEDREHFDQIMQAHSGKKAAEEPLNDEIIGANADDEDTTTVLIAVISSRDNFKSRVRSIMATWGQPDKVPKKITIRFFVGAADESAGVVSGSEQDIADLASEAGVGDLSQVVVMTDIVDDEYPPVTKNSGMIRHLEEIVLAFENDATAPSSFQWIYKVDDDAYVHFDGLLKFLRKRNPAGYHVYGERGHGRAEDRGGLASGGLSKPYCTGGPGYVLSRPTLKRTAAGMDDCLQNADVSPYREYLWHSDVVIGMCVQKQTEAGCWTDDDYHENRIFRHNLKAEDPFLGHESLKSIVAMHPYKDKESMQKLHSRFLKLKSSSKGSIGKTS